MPASEMRCGLLAVLAAIVATDAQMNETDSPATDAPMTVQTQDPSPTAANTSAPATSTPSAPKDCGTGGKSSGGCCLCFAGWAKAADGRCTVCATGFFGSDHGFCTNGRPGSMCYDGKGLPYPMGCGAGGMCSKKNGQSVFPCQRCQGGMSPKTGCTQPTKCMPAGPTIYTPFPNRPVADHPFNLVVVGCGLESVDDFAIVPAYNSRMNEEASPASCGEVHDDTFDAECTFNATEAKPLQLCSSGIRISGGVANRHFDSRAGSTTRIALTGIELTKEFVAPFERPQQFDPTMTESLFMLCTRTTRVTPSGKTETVWRAVAGHNEDVSMRDFNFAVDASMNLMNPRGAAGAEGTGDCCDGLQLGDWCLPLWAFLLLWILMLGSLAALVFMLHKNHAELEQQRNNLKIEQLCQDSELMDLDDNDMMDL